MQSKHINSDIKKWIDKLPKTAFINKSNKYYVDNSILNPLPLVPYNETQWKKLFNLPPKSDYSKLQMTAIGTYSIGQPDINKDLIRFIMECIKDVNLDLNTLTITETNGGLGGFSSALLQNFNNLNIVELNPTHYEIIQNNLEVYGYGDDPTKKIIIFEQDYLNKMLELSQDIIIADLPWGGPNYINQSSIRLGFSNIDLAAVINFLLSHNKFKLFIFLAPIDYNFNMFLSQIKTNNIYITKVRHHNFVCIYGNK